MWRRHHPGRGTIATSCKYNAVAGWRRQRHDPWFGWNICAMQDCAVTVNALFQDLHNISHIRPLVSSSILNALPFTLLLAPQKTMGEKHVHFSRRATVAVVEHSPKDSISYSIDDYRTFRKQARRDVASYHRDRNKPGHNSDAVASIVGLENFLCKSVFERAATARDTHRRAVLEAQRRLRILQEGGTTREMGCCYEEFHQFVLFEVSAKYSAELEQRAREIGMRLQFDVIAQ